MKPLPAWPEGPAPPLLGFRQVPLGCGARMEGMERMEAREKLGALVPWKSLAGTTPSFLQTVYLPIPPPEASGSTPFCLPSPGFPAGMVLLFCFNLTV